MKFIFTILLLTVFYFNSESAKQITVIATTSWTASYALAAGADHVIVLAPYEMVHPSEYELRPGDIERLQKSDMIIYAGYEVIVNQIKNGLNISDSKFEKIVTSFNYEEIEKSVMQIATKIGTEQIALKNLRKIRDAFDLGRAEMLKSNLKDKPILVHFFQESFVKELGLKPTRIFGPAPLEPKQLLELARTGAAVIVDNVHSPVGAPMKGILENGVYKLLLNFPGLYGTRSIEDVIHYNTKQLYE